MQNTTEDPGLLADALAMVKKLADIVAAYGPEYAHGERTDKVVGEARKLLARSPCSFEVVPAAEFCRDSKP